ncbi:MAG: hypothetical protein OEZ06_00250 [Myxococcales bacterium]|nr:hypothetical protein [Myxococcales bacterium]
MPQKPPPKLPPEVSAQARVRTLERDLAAFEEPRARAAFHYEIGSLLERRMGQSEPALEHYEKANALWPRLLPSLWAHAALCQRLGRSALAEAGYRRFADLTPVPVDRARALVEAGLLAWDELGDRAAAQRAWEAALRADPSCLMAAHMLELEARGRGDFGAADRALRVRTEATTDPQLEALLRLELGLQLERQGEREAAFVEVQAAADVGVESLGVLQQLERMAREGGRAEEQGQALLALCRRAERLATQTEEPWARSRAAALLRQLGALEAGRLGRPAAAMAAYDRALSLVPDDPLCRVERHQLHRQQGDLERACADLEAFLELELPGGDRALLLTEIAVLRRALGDSDGELEALRGAVLADRRSAAALASFEDALLERGLLGLLCEHLVERAYGHTGLTRARHLLRAARLAVADGEFEQAHGWLGEAIELCSELAPEQPPLGEAAALRRLLLHERHAVALRASDPATPLAVLQEILEGPGCEALPSAERALLELQRMWLLGRAGRERAAALEAALAGADSARWAADLAWVVGAREQRPALLARAHRVLAEQAGDGVSAGGHLCAAARAELRAGDQEAAERDLRAALVHTPDHRWALSALQELLLARGETAMAAELLERAASEHGSARERERSLLQAAAAAADDPGVALKLLREAVAHAPNSLSARWGLLRLAEDQADAELWQQALDGLADATGGGASELPEELRAAAAAARLERAETRAALGADPGGGFEALLASNGSSVAAALGVWLGAGADATAVERARALLEAQLEGELAGLLATDRLLASAASADTPGLPPTSEAAPDDDDPLPALVGLRAAAGGRDRADALLGVAAHADLGEGAKGAGLVLHAIRCQLIEGGRGEADDALLRALELAAQAPSSLAAQLALDETLSAGDDPEVRARALFGRIAHTGEQSALPLSLARARALLAAGRSREAADAARRVLSKQKGEPAALEVLRMASRALGDWEQLMATSRRLANLCEGPEKAALLEEIAQVLDGELGDSVQAEQLLREALEAEPGRPSAFDHLHDLIAARGDFAGLYELLEMLPDDPERRAELRLERAWVLRAMGWKEEALGEVEEYLEDHRDEVEALSLRAELLANFGRYREALPELERVVELAPEVSQRIEAHRNAATWLEHQLDDAEGAYRQLAALACYVDDDPELWLHMARLAARAGLVGERAKALRAAALLARGSAAAELELQAAQLLESELDDREAAVAAYRAALEAQPLHYEALRGLHGLIEADAREALLLRFVQHLGPALSREPDNSNLLLASVYLGEMGANSELARRSLLVLRSLGFASEDQAAKIERLPPPRTEIDPEAITALVDELTPGCRELLAASAAVFPTPERPAAPTTWECGQALVGRLQALAVAFGLQALGARTVEDFEGIEVVEEDPGHVYFRVASQHGAELSVLERHRLGRQLMAIRIGCGRLLGQQPAEQRRRLQLLVEASQDEEATDVVGVVQRLGRSGRRAVREAVEALGDGQSLDDALASGRVICERAGLRYADDPAGLVLDVLGPDPVDPDAVREHPTMLTALGAWLLQALPSDVASESEGDEEAAP